MKLLRIMLRNRCWPTNFHAITPRDVDKWCHKSLTQCNSNTKKTTSATPNTRLTKSPEARPSPRGSTQVPHLANQLRPCFPIFRARSHLSAFATLITTRLDWSNLICSVHNHTNNTRIEVTALRCARIWSSETLQLRRLSWYGIFRKLRRVCFGCRNFCCFQSCFHYSVCYQFLEVFFSRILRYGDDERNWWFWVTGCF